MTHDLDRFRVARTLATYTAAPMPVATPPAPAPRRALVPLEQLKPERQPVTHSTRGPRFVDHTMCPMCGTERLGLEYHGILRSGAKVHTITAHTPGMRSVVKGNPRCLGAGMRMLFEDGVWKGAPAK